VDPPLPASLVEFSWLIFSTLSSKWKFGSLTYLDALFATFGRLLFLYSGLFYVFWGRSDEWLISYFFPHRFPRGLAGMTHVGSVAGSLLPILSIVHPHSGPGRYDFDTPPFQATWFNIEDSVLCSVACSTFFPDFSPGPHGQSINSLPFLFRPGLCLFGVLSSSFLLFTHHVAPCLFFSPSWLGRVFRLKQRFPVGWASVLGIRI